MTGPSPQEDERYDQPLRDYSALTREELERRLSLAEDVVMLFSWTGNRGTDRDKAAHELWRIWLAEVGDAFTNSANHPHLDDEALRPLVTRRDRIRERTLARIRGDRAGDPQ